jgi:hypothetical protein
MLQSESYCRPGPPGGAAANGIHDHQHGTAVQSQQAVNILRSFGFFYTVSGEVLAHCGDEWFRVRHSLIVAPVQELPAKRRCRSISRGKPCGGDGTFRGYPLRNIVKRSLAKGSERTVIVRTRKRVLPLVAVRVLYK